MVRAEDGEWRTGNFDKSKGYMRTTFQFTQEGSTKRKENGSIVSNYFYIHRLMAEAFHGPPPSGRNDCHHIDEDKTNNSPENLQWVSRTTNMAISYQKGFNVAANSRKVDQYTKDGEFIRTFDSRTEAAKAVGLSGPAAISRSLQKGTFSKGFSWKSHED